VALDASGEVLEIAFPFQIVYQGKARFAFEVQSLCQGGNPPDYCDRLEGLQSFVAASSDGALRITATATLELAMGIDLVGADDRENWTVEEKAFLYNANHASGGTTWSMEINAALENTSFKMRTGPLTLWVVDGANPAYAVLNMDGQQGQANGIRFDIILVKPAGQSARSYFTENLQDQLDIAIVGQAKASFPLYFSSDAPADFVGLLEVTITDVAAYLAGNVGVVDITTPNLGTNGGLVSQAVTVVGMLTNLDLLIDGLDAVLSRVQDALNGRLYGLSLPLIGDILAENPAAQFIGNLRAQLLGQVADKLRESGLDKPAVVLQSVLASVFLSLGLLKDLNYLLRYFLLRISGFANPHLKLDSMLWWLICDGTHF
jgi:hypothetical protein